MKNILERLTSKLTRTRRELPETNITISISFFLFNKAKCIAKSLIYVRVDKSTTKEYV